ncbi:MULTISPECIES: hypothetical protein [Providencia]|uniref:hypothetical protein n=1 Tax=Providencia TaxID=586 RepID=UPI00247FB0AB|nr:hypothetical protein [Providencia rettgeri]
MNSAQAIEILSNSQQDDWLIDTDTGSFTYKEDLNLHIQCVNDNDREFNEDWAIRHSNPNAFRVTYLVKYGNSLVERKYLVAVDGGRAILPMPISAADLRVRSADVNFANIVNVAVGDVVGEYIRRSGLTIV